MAETHAMLTGDLTRPGKRWRPYRVSAELNGGREVQIVYAPQQQALEALRGWLAVAGITVTVERYVKRTSGFKTWSGWELHRLPRPWLR